MIVQLAPEATVAGQLWVWVKSVGTVTPVKLTASLPMFV
jgi:hypothetical protein